MSFETPKLPYAQNALEPVISQQTIEYHYGKHLQNYVNTLNKLIVGTEYEGKSIVEIVKTAPDGAIFNNAGQALKLAEAINRDFGSFEAFQKKFTEASLTLFGSGWAFLSIDKEGKLVITQEANGSNPVRRGYTPIFGIDVWEHAYYLDYQNRRADHIEAVWSIIDWEVVESRMK